MRQDLKSVRITVDEIAARLQVGRLSVYALLERSEIPAIRLGKRWIITRRAYVAWEENCGMKIAVRPIPLARPA